MTPRATLHAHRVSRLASLVLLEGLRRQWTLAASAAPFAVHREVPYPGCLNGFSIDPATGLGLGWDGTTVGYFVDAEGLPGGLICAWDGYGHWYPSAGERGFHHWDLYTNGDRVGVMVAPRVGV